MLHPALMAQLWPLHGGIWIACACVGALAGWVLANQTEARWTAVLINLAIVLSMTLGLAQVVSVLSLQAEVPDLSSGEQLFQLYLDLSEFRFFSMGQAHLMVVVQSTAIAMTAWLVSSITMMFARWDDAV